MKKADILRLLRRDQDRQDRASLKCSFCGKSADEVKRLLSGQAVYICDECVESCNQILEQHEDAD